MTRAQFHEAALAIAHSIPERIEAVHLNVDYVVRFMEVKRTIVCEQGWEWGVEIHTAGRVVYGHAPTPEVALDKLRGKIAERYGSALAEKVSHAEQLASAEMSGDEMVKLLSQPVKQ